MTHRLRRDARAILEAGVLAVDAGAATRRYLQSHPIPGHGPVWLLGAGKAAGAMAEVAETMLGHRVAGGLVVVPRGTEVACTRVSAHPSTHPVPDEHSVEAATCLLEQIADIPPDHQVVFLLTGGASSLLVAPAEGLTLADLHATTHALLHAGVAIDDLNTVRKHLSAIKGGWLAAHLSPRRTQVLAISDVIGDDLSVLGSGPLSPDPSTFADARRVLARAHLRQALPPAVLAHLTDAAEETPKPGNPWFSTVQHTIISSLRDAARAASRSAERLGYDVDILDLRLSGEARHVGATLAARGRELRRTIECPTCLLFGGETTVQVTGTGRGGRNQELALAAALELRDVPGVVVFSIGTDGVDGPTDAAGAIVDHQTTVRILDKGLDPRSRLQDNDSHPALEAAGDLVRLAPTRTNVMDLMGVLVQPRQGAGT